MENGDFFTCDYPSNCVCSFTYKYLHYCSFSTLHSHEWTFSHFHNQSNEKFYLHIFIWVYITIHIYVTHIQPVLFFHIFLKVLIANAIWVLPREHFSDLSGKATALYHSNMLIKLWAKRGFPQIFIFSKILQ